MNREDPARRHLRVLRQETPTQEENRQLHACNELLKNRCATLCELLAAHGIPFTPKETSLC